MLEKGDFQSILIDTAVMNLPATSFSLVANRLIKQEFGLPVGCAPSNGSYMWRKSAQTVDATNFAAVDASIHALATLDSNFLFYGPMSGTERTFYAVAIAACLATMLNYEEGRPIPSQTHPLRRFFPDFVEQLLSEEGEQYGNNA